MIPPAVSIMEAPWLPERGIVPWLAAAPTGGSRPSLIALMDSIASDGVAPFGGGLLLLPGMTPPPAAVAKAKAPPPLAGWLWVAVWLPRTSSTGTPPTTAEPGMEGE